MNIPNKDAILAEINKLPLGENEKIEWIEKPNKKVYMATSRVWLFLAILSFLLIDGYIYRLHYLVMDGYNLWVQQFNAETKVGTAILLFLFINIPTVMALGAYFRAIARFPNSFHAYSNSRIIFSTLAKHKKIDFVYYSNVHDLEINKKNIKIDTNDYSRYSKRYTIIVGVENPEELVKALNIKLEKIRQVNT